MTRALSIDDLPYVNGGVLGMWLIQLRDSINSHHAGVAWEGGKSMQPVTGAVLRRFVAASNNVIGALRVEGEPHALGDCSTLLDGKPFPASKASADEAASQSRQKADEAKAEAARVAAEHAAQAAHDARVVALLTEAKSKDGKKQK